MQQTLDRPEARAAIAPVAPVSRRWILIATCLASFMAFLDATIVNIAFPSIQSSFPEVSRTGLSWVLNGYNIVFAALLLPAGRFADRVGRRRGFLLGIAVFGSSSALCALAPSAALLVAMRALQAVGAALLVPTALGLLLDGYALHERVRAIAVLGAAAALAAASGPVLGGVLVDAFDWRAVFVVNLPLCLVTLWLVRRYTSDRREAPDAGLPDPLGILLFTAAMGLLALGLSQAQAWGWDDIRTIACLGVGAALVPAFVLRCIQHPSPAVEMALLTTRKVRLANISVIVFSAAFYAKILIDVLFLTSVWHYSVLGAGAAMTAGPLITALVATPAGYLADRWGAGIVAALGGVIYCVACLWYVTQTGPTPNYLAQWLPGAGLTGTGLALALPSLTSAAVQTLPPARYATGSALNATARQLGGVLGIAIAVSLIGGGVIVTSASGFDHAWIFAACCAALAVVTSITIDRRGVFTS